MQLFRMRMGPTQLYIQESYSHWNGSKSTRDFVYGFAVYSVAHQFSCVSFFCKTAFIVHYRYVYV